ncbi:hypothetical protein [Yoonia sp. SDW83-1]|uniref:hypothetical protein n=1 Tax=Yoonia sp. SDW83-1 TaxID=3366945 RepID=UPI00398C46EA
MIRSLLKIIFGLFLAILSLGLGTALQTLLDPESGSGLSLAIPLISLVLTVFGVVLCIVGFFQFITRAFRAATKLGKSSDV